MGMDPLTIGLGLAAFSSVMQIGGGISANNAAKDEAALQEQQAELARQEALQNADTEAHNQRTKLNAQKLAFLKSGVSLEGSPLLVLEDTRSYGQQMVDSIVRRGDATYNLGMMEAQQTKNKGRAALLSGFTGAATTLGSSLLTAGTIKTPKTPKTPKTSKINGGQIGKNANASVQRLRYI